MLRNVSFEVQPGQRVAIVGATGSGKTTIVSLLLRFYDVQQGRITIDGVDIRDMDLSALRRRFGLVLQDVYLFSGTIGGNIRLGNPSITDEDVRRALDAVHASRFVDRLPQGVRDAGRPSGERRSRRGRSSCCRSRVRWRSIRDVLILDEATSSVDTDTELLIRDALKVVMRGRTTIAIAHRLSTIQDMDRILVLHKGELRESGTHQELLAARGIYHRLYQLQFESTAALESAQLASDARLDRRGVAAVGVVGCWPVVGAARRHRLGSAFVGASLASRRTPSAGGMPAGGGGSGGGALRDARAPEEPIDERRCAWRADPIRDAAP